MKFHLVQILALTCGISLAGRLASAVPIPEDCQTGGFALGCQAWTFKEYPVLEAIEKTAAVGGKVIEFYPGRKFSAESPGLKFDHNATDEMVAAAKAQLKKSGIRTVNYGVVQIPLDDAGARKIFEFTKQFELFRMAREFQTSRESWTS